jgi:hypothetical protein
MTTPSEAEIVKLVERAEEVRPASIASAAREWPEMLEGAALHGIAGDLVQLLDPHTEADPVAILVQFLAAFGSSVGRGPHFVAEADQHGPNLFAVFVGATSKGRKGTSWGQAKRAVDAADSSWPHCVVSGLSSGEGLIWQVRDPIEKRIPIKQKGRIVRYEDELVDHGVPDKRLLVFEGEFASTLRVLGRDGNTLGAVLRLAWDKGDLRTLTKNTPAKATGAHISIVGHITRHELLRYLDDTEAGNGFANRFLWLCVRRSKVLPEGGSLDPEALIPIAQRVREAIEFARQTGEMRRDDEARTIWRKVYSDLSEGRPGLLGAILARAEAQVMRLALIYGLLDRSRAIGAPHLRAALAVWEYSEASTQYIFGDRLGDPVADAILNALRAQSDGLSRTEISAIFGRHTRSGRIDAALGSLLAAGRVQKIAERTEGRSVEKWRAARVER